MISENVQLLVVALRSKQFKQATIVMVYPPLVITTCSCIPTEFLQAANRNKKNDRPQIVLKCIPWMNNR